MFASRSGNGRQFKPPPPPSGQSQTLIVFHNFQYSVLEDAGQSQVSSSGTEATMEVSESEPSPQADGMEQKSRVRVAQFVSSNMQPSEFSFDLDTLCNVCMQDEKLFKTPSSSKPSKSQSAETALSRQTKGNVTRTFPDLKICISTAYDSETTQVNWLFIVSAEVRETLMENEDPSQSSEDSDTEKIASALVEIRKFFLLLTHACFFPCCFSPRIINYIWSLIFSANAAKASFVLGERDSDSSEADGAKGMSVCFEPLLCFRSVKQINGLLLF